MVPSPPLRGWSRAVFTSGALLLTAAAPAQVRAQAQPATPQDSALIAMQTELVKLLTGGEEILPGVSLPNRGASEHRAVVREYLAQRLAGLGLEVRRQPYREDGENVYALLPGTVASDEYVVVGAHFDTVERSPGASDNATGCAVVMGVAEHLVGLPDRERNVFLIFFDEEERGLVGSRAFAEMLGEEGKSVVAVHTIDQMGWDQDGDGAIELELPYEGAVELYRRAAEESGFAGQVHLTQEPGSDHSAFRRLGMPAVGLTEEYRNGDTTPHIHRPSDTWDTVDFGFLADGTRLVRAAMTILVGGTGQG